MDNRPDDGMPIEIFSLYDAIINDLNGIWHIVVVPLHV